MKRSEPGKHPLGLDKCRNARMSDADRVLAGFELIEIQRAYGLTPGRRTDLESSRLNWANFIRQEFGISDVTARRWILMAKGIAPHLKKAHSLHAITLLNDWTPEQIERLSEILNPGNQQDSYRSETVILPVRVGFFYQHRAGESEGY